MRIFINMYQYSNDWIMGKIAYDIMETSNKLGYECRCGKFEDYNGEDICYHLAYPQAVPMPNAKHNSVFYTHLNNTLKERNFVGMKDLFDSFICMSPEDAEYLIELGFNPNKVFGMTLPVRNTYIRPISIGIFSACYPDGRKNEAWLVDFCRKNEDARLVNWVFVGPGWGDVVKELESLYCTSEWHNVSRKMPYEYQFQQNMLANLNYYIYMGMDGGAMGTYDAYAQDVPLCVTFDGFHKSIPDLDYVFDNKESFMEQLGLVVAKHARRLGFFRTHTSENYVKWILDVWQGKFTDPISEHDKKCLNYRNVLEKKREQYYKIDFSSIKNILDKKYEKIKTRLKLKISK